MADTPLNKFEVELVRAIGEARTANFRGDPDAQICATVLRNILFAQPLLLPGDDASRIVVIPSYGVRIVAARIEGELALDDVCGVADAALAPLMLEECFIPAAIHLSRARLRHFSLRDSRITYLCAISLTIETGIVLSGLASTEIDGLGRGYRNKGLCHIEMRRARIGGSVDAVGVRLAGPPKRAEFVRYSGMGANYALDLGGSNIVGTVMLRLSEIWGGCSLSGAEIKGDLRCDGAKFVAVESEALTAEMSHIDGFAGLRASDAMNSDSVPFRSTGEINLLGTNIRATLDMSGARISASGGRCAVAIADAQIGGDAFFRAREGMRGGRECILPFRAAGGVDLRNTKIAADLEMLGAVFVSTNGRAALQASNAEIRGSVSFVPYDGRKNGEAHAFPAGAIGMVNFAGATIGSDFNMGGARLRAAADGVALYASNSTIGGNLYLGTWIGERAGRRVALRFSSIGQIDLSGRKIVGSFYANGAQLVNAASNVPNATKFAVNAVNLEVGGDVLLNGDSDYLFESAGEITFWGATIGRSFEMTGSVIRKDVFGQRRKSRFSRFFSLVLQNGRIEGDLKLQHVVSEGVLWMRDARVGGALNVSPFQVFREQGAPQSANAARLVEIDLSSVQLGRLDDGDGDDWGKAVLLRLDGLTVGRLESTGNYAFRNLDLATRQLLGGHWVVARLVNAVSVFAQRLARPIRRPLWKRRLDWLNLQYASRHATPMEYKPGPYELVTRAFRMEGDYIDARKIASKRLSLERNLFHWPWLSPVWWVKTAFWLFFDYGLSVPRALATFVLCIGLGAFFSYVADQGLTIPHETISVWPDEHLRVTIPAFTAGRVLVINTTAVNTVAVSDPRTKNASPGALDAAPSVAHTEELPCGNQVEPLLYAVDTFVPGIDLRQESKCMVSAKKTAYWWRIGKAAYAVLGWIVTSILVLTVTGILRRQAES